MTSPEEDNNKEGEVSAEVIFEPPARYITIRLVEDGPVELDIGDISYYTALGLLKAAIRKMEEREPYMDLRAGGVSLDEQELAFLGDIDLIDDSDEDDDDEDDEGEEAAA